MRGTALLGVGCQGSGVGRNRCRVLVRFVLYAIFMLLTTFAPLRAQMIDQTPWMPDLLSPNGINSNSPMGETPYSPSQPPTGYKPVQTPGAKVIGDVSLPVSGGTLKLDADIWRVEFDEGEATVVTATGNVKATYQNYTITSQTANIDLKSKSAVFTGSVVLTLQGQDIRGTSLSINLDTRDWSFETAEGVLSPELFPQLIRAPVFLAGKKIIGTKDNEVTVTDGGFTTCNLDYPHYIIDAKNSTVWPERRLIVRKAAFYVNDRRIFTIPRIVVPLNQVGSHPGLIPRIGQTAEEGFYLKAAYALTTSERNYSNIRLDLMSKKGIGVGFDDHYNLGTGTGSLLLYQLSDQNRNQNTMTGRWTHEHRIGSITANFISNYRSNSFMYSPGSTSLSNEVRISRKSASASTNLGIRQSIDSGFGRFSILTSNLQHARNLSDHSSVTMNMDYFKNVSPLTVNGQTVNAARSQLTSRMDYSQRNKQYDWNLRLNKINDLSSEEFISQSGVRFAGMEKLPELALTTSTERLGKSSFLGLPLRFDVAVGRYREDFGRIETERAVTDIDIPTRVYKLGDKLKLNAGGGFKQYVYGDGTAQYSIDANAELTKQIGVKSNAALSYRYLRPRGYTPFRFDFIGKNNVITGRLNVQETPRLKYSLNTGYNFGQKDFKWQDITARVSYAPSDRWLLYTSAGYNLNRSQWRPIINQLRVRLANDLKIDIGSRYDTTQGQFSSLKFQLDTPVGDKWRIRANAGYNGFTNAFDYKNIEIVRDLHCWELSVAWVDQASTWQDRGIRLSLRIKAFPIFDTFGVGQFGQALDTSVGETL